MRITFGGALFGIALVALTALHAQDGRPSGSAERGFVANGRIREFPAIVDELLAMSAAEGNKEVAEIRSAIALTEDQKSRLAEALGKATGKQVEVRVIIDPSIKGGIVAQVGDTVIDGSVRRRLEQLKNTL